ncbi:hypothetical protein PRIPAC_71155 [Pristionchus pacificus]|uniref:phospholipase A2 n=1 Tax=Pristionchus pacificus TaxID=54126 RepID=A0A2A6BGK5_PRIPA|nr:hypothetical protein PRIPAC_71155 [Pristionchus pacificus]|eukprot:PDM64988.1 Ankyrin repeat-containing protein [Pristionchus pacificus]
MLNFVKSLATNEAVQKAVMDQANSLLQKAGRGSTVTTPTTPEQKECTITAITPAKLNEMEKLDRLSGFSCYFDRKADTVHVILLTKPSLSVWNGSQEMYAKQLASLLDPMVDVTEESSESIRRDRLKTLLTTVSSRESFDWQPIHLASACGFTKALDRICAKDAQVAVSHATRSGLLPLHIAVNWKAVESVRYLLSKGAALNKGDSNGRTVLHYAVQQEDTRILELLLSSPSLSLSPIDGDGCTPLFIALQSNRPLTIRRCIDKGTKASVDGSQPVLFSLVGKNHSPELEECLQYLIRAFPTVIEDKNAGGQTIFHTRLDKNILSCLLYLSNPSSFPVDSRGRSPLSIAASSSDLDSVLLFLSYNANPNEMDEEGMTALHRAIMAGDANIAKALLIFGADPNLMTKDGRTADNLCSNVAISHALRLLKGQSNEKIVSIGELEAFQLNRALIEISKGGKNHAISLDGGGIRGLVLIELLSSLESVIGPSLLSSFSWLAGTSTGAILALALAQGKTVNECRKLYIRFKDRVFFGRRPYSEKSLEEFLKKEFGPTTTLDSLKDKRVLVTTCDGTLCPPELKLLRSYTAPLGAVDLRDMGYGDPTKATVWYAARCSSAAPTYFAPVEGKWMDGGLVANNPCGELLQDMSVESDAMELRGGSPLGLGVVLSLGTGRQKSLKVEAVNLDMPSGVFSFFQSIETIKHLKNVFVEQLCRADGPIVNRARSWTSSKNGAFFRFSPQFDAEIALDETNNAILIDMMWKTKEYMHTQKEYVQFLSKMLQIN